ncbi:SCO-spondin-like [Mercenaria mercenaria]|uniref:SCO-spondin-like n=1 Tax=Mercenaria mercenaria TaxID=6596 RepID=UPI00234F48DE|nr:SCO-spondin-like [Mercenaria mercenaria]
MCECIGTNLICIQTDCQYCRYTDWEPWSDCTKSCDVGLRSRSRELLPIQNWEMCILCNGSREEIEDCNTQSCSGWSAWVPWSGCSVSEPCTFGIRTRNRVCTGTGCEGDGLEIEPCGEPCDEAESNCTNDRVWSNCASHVDQTCGGLSTFFTEWDTCDTGCVCKPDLILPTSSGSCISDSICPCYTEDGQAVPQGQSLVKGCITCHCNGTNQQLDCTTITNCCEWTQWTSWGSCDVTCGTGTRQRYRELISGENCGPDVETEHCTVECPADCIVDGNGYYCGNTTSENSTHTCYCTVENTISCVKNIPANDTCRKYTKMEILYDAVGDCHSAGEIPVDYCTGSCGNSTFETVLVLSADSDGGQSVNCPCCTGTFYDEKEQIEAVCGPTKEPRVAYIPRIKECSCNPCSGATSVSLPSTTTAVR